MSDFVFVRSDYPPKRAQVAVTDKTTVGDLKTKAAEALGVSGLEYLFYTVSFGNDVVELTDLKLNNSNLEQANIKPGSSIVLAATPTNSERPKSVVKKRKTREEVTETTGSAPSDLDPENAIAKIEKLKPSDRKAAFEWLDKKAKAVFESKGFIKATRPLLKEILKRDTLKITEGEVLQGILRWARASVKSEDVKGEDLKKAIGDLLPLIRFPTMSAKDVAATVVPLNILEGSVVLALFSYIAQAEAGVKPSIPEPLKPYSNVKRKSHVEIRWSTGLTGVDRTVTSAGSGWRCVRGVDLWTSGVNEFTFVMRVRGYSSGTSIICGVAPDSINLDSQYPGYSSSVGAGIGDQGSTFGGSFSASTQNKKPSGRFFDEGDEIRIVYDQTKATVTFYNNKSEICVYNSVSGTMCPVVSLYGTSVIEWID